MRMEKFFHGKMMSEYLINNWIYYTIKLTWGAKIKKERIKILSLVYNFLIAALILFRLSSFPKTSATSNGPGLAFSPVSATRIGQR